MSLVLTMLLAGGVEGPRRSVSFHGEITRGQQFTKPFGPGLEFALIPVDQGWEIVVRDKGRDENIARLTPPWHFVPNPRWIEGWHFRNVDNTRPNDGSVNAPQEEREFLFSPEVGKTIDYPPTAEEMERVRAFGQGVLLITKLVLGNLTRGQKAHIEHMWFRVSLSWPREYRNEEKRAAITSPNWAQRAKPRRGGEIKHAAGSARERVGAALTRVPNVSCTFGERP